MNLFCKLLFTLIITSNSVLFAQKTKLDSLFEKVNADKEDTIKLKHLSQLNNELVVNRKHDTLGNFLKIQYDLANALIKNNIEKGIPVYQFLYTSLGDNHSALARSYYYQSKYDEAKENFLLAIPYYKKSGFKKGVATCNQNVGAIYYFLGNYSKCLEYFSAAAKMHEDIGNKGGVADMHVNLGSAYRILGKEDIAMDHYLMALKNYKEVDNKSGIAMSYMNIGVIYFDKKEYNKSLENQLLSLKIKKEIGDKKGLAESYCNVGAVYSNLHKNAEALENYSTGLKLYDEIKDNSGMTYCLNYIGEVYADKKDYVKSIEFASKGLALANEIGLKDMMRESYKILSFVYAAKKDYKMAYEFHLKFTDIKDTLFNQESNHKFAEMNARYENDKKEKEIKLIKTEQDKERAISEQKNFVQKIVIWSVIIGLLLVGIFAVVLLRTLKHTRHQKTIIEVKQKEILDSIYYAKRIQTSLLPTEKYIEKSTRH